MKKNILLHGTVVILLLIISAIYFMPILQGKALPQGDLQKYESMAKSQKDYHKATGEYTTWCPSMFSGMPGYQITNSPQHSVFTPVKNVLNLTPLNRHNDMGVMFLYLIGFYIALLAFGASPWLSLLGALAFGLGSYNIIIIEAGHISKAWAMAMIAPILAGMIMCLKGAYHLKEDRKKASGQIIWGAILFTMALGLQIAYNHIQITFYTAITGILVGLVYAIYAVKDRLIKQFFISVGILVVGAGLALACNIRHLMVNQEYVQYTMRGGSEITVTPQDIYGETYPQNNNTNQEGLDINYAFSWSYGIGETYTLLVPGAMGGGSGETVNKESASYQKLHIEQAPLYWGDQPFTSGPVYFGAIVIFLAIFGFIVVKGPERWWILAATIIAIMLSWGRNFMGFNSWIFDNLPLYNKFRTPSMSLVIANVAMVLIAVLGLKEVFGKPLDKEEVKKRVQALYISFGATTAIILAGLFMQSGFSYSGSSDLEMAQQYGNQWPLLQEIFIQDRQALFVSDSWRSIIFILMAAAAMWVYIKKMASTGKSSLLFIGLIALLIVVDLQGVNNRYLNEDKYVRTARMLEQKPAQYDYDIDNIAAQTGDKDFRVLTLAANTFNDSKPSAFHNQIGGYSAAKLRRYQDLIDFYISYQINPNVLNMLNTRYIVMQNGQVQRNPDAMGNCWFVSEVNSVTTPNDEIIALQNNNPRTTAIINTEEFPISTDIAFDSSATITLEHKQPNDINCLTYKSKSNTDQLAVFSEIYYEPDWKAYIDGKPAEYIRANYVLRAMMVPAGEHVIEFRNEAPTMHRLDSITLICSIATMLIIAGVLFIHYRRKTKAA